jgi:hypothetical protein
MRFCLLGDEQVSRRRYSALDSRVNARPRYDTAMRRAAIICAAGLAIAVSSAAVGSTRAVGSNREPHLATVAQASGHLMLGFTVGDLTPVEVQVASSTSTLASGAFPSSHVKLQERMKDLPQTGVLHWRTRTALPTGNYYVHVEAALTGGVTSCPRGINCLLRWSNIVRVQVP